MKVINLKAAALAVGVLLVGAALPPFVHAFIPNKPGGQVFASPALSAEASAQATGTQTVPTSPVAETQSIVLQHTVAGQMVKFLHWDQAAKLPAGVIKIEAVPAQNALNVTAIPAGQAQVRAIVSSLDIEPRQVQIRIAYANVTEAVLGNSRIDFGLVPPSKTQSGSSGTVYVRSASGSPVVQLLQTLTKQSIVTQAPECTTTSECAALINFSSTLPSGRTTSTGISATPLVNNDASVTLALRLVLSDGPVKREISTLRKINNGDTIVLVMPSAAAQATGPNLVLFVTATVK